MNVLMNVVLTVVGIIQLTASMVQWQDKRRARNLKTLRASEQVCDPRGRSSPMTPLLKNTLILGGMLPLIACSKTVQWEEEVPLNTGLMLLVKRSDTFVKRAEPGNPLSQTWGLDQRTYEFRWHGQAFAYHIRTKAGGPILIQVLPDNKSIVVVDSARECEKPGWAEFRWVNGTWDLQRNVDRSLLGQPRNLMAYFSSEPGAIPLRVSNEVRKAMDTNPRHGTSKLTLDPALIAVNCSRRK